MPAKVFALKMEGSLIDDVEDDSISTAAQFMYISRLPTLSKIKEGMSVDVLFMFIVLLRNRLLVEPLFTARYVNVS